MEGGDRERSFKVEDRRRFTESGEAREESQERQEQTASPGPATPPEQGATSRPAEEPAEITFASFLIGLSTQALIDLGEIPHPADHSTQIDLAAAQQIIDVLAVLREKTKGNLDETESALLENALYDLRMKYVERARNRS